MHINTLKDEERMLGRTSPLDAMLEELDGFFPAFIPLPTMTDREIMFRAGQRSVVEYLMSKQE